MDFKRKHLYFIVVFFVSWYLSIRWSECCCLFPTLSRCRSFLVNPYFLSTKRMRVLQYTLACWSSYQTSGNTALPASVYRFRWLIILSDIAGWLMLRLVSLWSGPHSICTTVNKCCLSLAWKLQSPAWLLFTSPPAHLSIKHTKSCPLRVRLRCNMQELAN